MSKTLMIADDAPIIRHMIRDIAQTGGWSVVAEAANGKQAAECYRQRQPDVVTLDLVMPEYDGIYALREILAHHPQAKVIVVSALDQKHVLTEAFQIGAADFLVKPFDRQQLLDTLQQLYGG